MYPGYSSARRSSPRPTSSTRSAVLVYSLPNGGPSAMVWGVRVILALFESMRLMPRPFSGQSRAFLFFVSEWPWQSSVPQHPLPVV